MKTLLLLMTVIFSLLNIGCESSGDDSGPSTPNNNPNTKNLLEVLNNKPFQTNCIKTKSNSYGLLELRKSNQNTILLNVKLFDDELCTENNKLINQYTLKSSNENYKLSEDRRENLGSLTVQSVSSESMKISLKSTEISALIDIQSSQTLTAYNYLSSAALITAGSKLKLEADSFYKTFTSSYDCSTASDEDINVVKLSYTFDSSQHSYYKELYISLNSSTGQLNFYAKTYEGQAAIPHMLSNQVSDNTYVWDILKTQKLIKMDEYGYRKLKATINLDPKNAYIDIPQDAIFEQPANLEVTKIDKKKLCN